MHVLFETHNFIASETNNLSYYSFKQQCNNKIFGNAAFTFKNGK